MEKTNTLCIPIVICDNSPFVRITFDGKDLLALVDSGCQDCLLDRKLISLPDEQLGKGSSLTGFGDASFVGHDIFAFFRIAEHVFCSICTVLDLGNALNKFKNTIGEVSGIIGGNFLCKYEAVIDYKAKELRIEESKITEIMEDTMKMINGQ